MSMLIADVSTYRRSDPIKPPHCRLYRIYGAKQPQSIHVNIEYSNLKVSPLHPYNQSSPLIRRSRMSNVMHFVDSRSSSQFYRRNAHHPQMRWRSTEIRHKKNMFSYARCCSCRYIAGNTGNTRPVRVCGFNFLTNPRPHQPRWRADRRRSAEMCIINSPLALS